MARWLRASRISFTWLFMGSVACGGAEADRSMAAREDAVRQFSPWSPPTVLDAVNTPGFDFPGSISRDGLSLYIHRGLAAGEELWVAHRRHRHDAWGAPERLPDTVNSPYNERRPYVSPDGHWLYFASDRPGGRGDYDLYVSWRRHVHDDSAWGPAVNLDDLGRPVNTPGYDAGPAIFHNRRACADELYFVSNPTGPQALADVYVSVRSRDGSFGPPALVPELSSPANEGGPELSRDGLELYLQSNRAGGLGGQDLWVSRRASVFDPWGAPANVAELNTTGQEVTPVLSWSGETLYFSILTAAGAGEIVQSTREKAHGDRDHRDDDPGDDDRFDPVE
jgi:hypothetical protein